MILDSQPCLSHGLMSKMVRMFYFNLYIYTEKDFTQTLALKKKIKKNILQEEFSTTLLSQGLLNHKNGEKSSVIKWFHNL